MVGFSNTLHAHQKGYFHIMLKSDVKKILGYLYAQGLLISDKSHEDLSDIILGIINFSDNEWRLKFY